MADEREVALGRLAAQQHGLITYAQARAILGVDRLRRAARAGRLVRAQPRVYRVAGAPASWHQRLLAAVLAGDGVASHRSAAHLWGLGDRPEEIDISVVPPRAPRLWSPACVHRVRDLPTAEVLRRQRIPLTDPVRTVVDLGLVLHRHEVDDALARGLSSKLFPISAAIRLRDVLGRPGRNGTGVLREVLDARLLRGDPGANALEARLGSLLQRHGLPLPLFQHELWHAGLFVARLDAAYPGVLLAIEVDGFESHASPAAFEADRRRQNHLVLLGWTILRFTWADVVRRPAAVARQVAAALEVCARS